MYKYITSYFVRKKYPSRVLITIEKDFYFFSTTLHFIEIFRNGIFIYTTLFVRILIKHNFKLLPTKSIFLRRLSHFIFRARRAFLLINYLFGFPIPSSLFFKSRMGYKTRTFGRCTCARVYSQRRDGQITIIIITRGCT